MTATGGSSASTSSTTTATAAAASTADGGRGNKRGAFIVLEGVDRCGKSTQVVKLVERLQAQGFAAEAIRFPDRTTTIGGMINAYLSNATELDDHAIHLLFSANRWEAVAGLKAKLQAGTTLVCDRYAYSGVAFSAAKPGIDFAWCKECDRGLPKPDAVLFLDLSPEKAAERGQYGEERYETKEMQARVRANFEKILEEDRAEGSSKGGASVWSVVDAGQPIEAVTKDLEGLALPAVKKAQAGAPLAVLWPKAADAAAAGGGARE